MRDNGNLSHHGIVLLWPFCDMVTVSDNDRFRPRKQTYVASRYEHSPVVQFALGHSAVAPVNFAIHQEAGIFIADWLALVPAWIKATLAPASVCDGTTRRARAYDYVIILFRHSPLPQI